MAVFLHWLRTILVMATMTAPLSSVMISCTIPATLNIPFKELVTLFAWTDWPELSDALRTSVSLCRGEFWARFPSAVPTLWFLCCWSPEATFGWPRWRCCCVDHQGGCVWSGCVCESGSDSSSCRVLGFSLRDFPGNHFFLGHLATSVVGWTWSLAFC